jgi:hypothetical protein
LYLPQIFEAVTPRDFAREEAMKIFGLILITLSLLLIAQTTLAQNVEYMGSTLWTGVNDTKIVGNYAYCAFQNGLVILSISNPAEPSFISRLYLQGSGFGIDVSGSYVYLADGLSGLQVINIANPANPILAGSCTMPSYAVGIFVFGEYAYVANYDHGLEIYRYPESCQSNIDRKLRHTGHCSERFCVRQSCLCS